MKVKMISKYSCLLFVVVSILLLVPFAFNAYASPRTDFIDVSHHNAETGLPLNFYQDIEKFGVKGVVVKVSQGTSFLDPAAANNITNARKAGLVVNGYHFAQYTNSSTAIKEADWFNQELLKVGFNKQTDGYIVIDIESNSANLSPSELTADTNAFIKELQSLGYTRIDIYSYSYFYNTNLVPNQLILNKPWLARYSTVSPNFPNGQGAWQWSSTYQFQGLTNYGYFDVSQDFAGKYITPITISTPISTTTTLKLGDTGSAVKTLQQSLNSKGFNVGVVDGVFGPATKNSVVKFQQTVHITIDGIYGPQTAKALIAYGLTTVNNTNSNTVTGIATIKADSLYLRSSNDFNSKAVKVLHKGNAFKVYGESNGMYNVGSGWITANTKYVTFTTNITTQSLTSTVTIKADSLYLRSANNFNSKPVKVLHKGESYKVYGKSNGMYNIGSGWVTASSKYVSFK